MQFRREAGSVFAPSEAAHPCPSRRCRTCRRGPVAVFAIDVVVVMVSRPCECLLLASSPHPGAFTARLFGPEMRVAPMGVPVTVVLVPASPSVVGPVPVTVATVASGVPTVPGLALALPAVGRGRQSRWLWQARWVPRARRGWCTVDEAIPPLVAATHWHDTRRVVDCLLKVFPCGRVVLDDRHVDEDFEKPTLMPCLDPSVALW